MPIWTLPLLTWNDKVVLMRLWSKLTWWVRNRNRRGDIFNLIRLVWRLLKWICYIFPLGLSEYSTWLANILILRLLAAFSVWNSITSFLSHLFLYLWVIHSLISLKWATYLSLAIASLFHALVKHLFVLEIMPCSSQIAFVRCSVDSKLLFTIINAVIYSYSLSHFICCAIS